MNFDREKLQKLIEDYGHAMYNLGEESCEYNKKQTGIARIKIKLFLDELEKVKK